MSLTVNEPILAILATYLWIRRFQVAPIVAIAKPSLTHKMVPMPK